MCCVVPCAHVQEHYCFMSQAHWKLWEAEIGAACQCSSDLEDLGGQMNGCSEVCAPISQLPASQHTRERLCCGMRILLGAGFINSEVANAGQLSLCFLRETVVFSLSSHRLYCSYIAISPPVKALLGRAQTKWWGLGGSWGWGSDSMHTAACGGLLCLCSVWRCSHCLWNAVLGILEEGPTKRERRKRGEKLRKKVEGRWPLNSATRKLWLNFSTGAVK